MTRGITNQFPAAQQLHDAIDVVSQLAEQADHIAGNGPSQDLLSTTLAATFRYMVAYSHHLTVSPDQPKDALEQAAAGLPELGQSELNFLRSYSLALRGQR